MDIPYTVELRRDTGLTNGKIGIWLFLASEVMLFGALFASYILIRTGAPSWPRGDTMLDVRLLAGEELGDEIYQGLEKHGLSREDAYMLCSLAGDLKILEIVDAGVWNVGMLLPRSVFV